jgi:hypothetical protein
MYLNKNNIILSVLIILISQTFAQNVWKPMNYSGIRATDKRIIFVDDFIDNRSNWPTGVPNLSLGKVEDGHYYWESFTNEASVCWRTIKELDENSDFEIETQIKFISGDEAAENALIWGKSENGEFDFGFSGNGNYTSSEYTKLNGYSDIIPWSTAGYFNKGNYNKLTIRKVNNHFYYFLNDFLIHSMPYRPFYGKKIGFQVGNKSIIHVEYLYIFQLVNPINSHFDIINSFNSAYDGIPDNSKSDIFSDQFNDNKHNWNRLNEYTECKLINGFLSLTSLNEKSQIAMQNINIPQNEDFEIETSIKFVTGDLKTANFLQWGRSDNDTKRQDFGFTGMGSYTIDNYNGSVWEDIVPFKSSTLLKKDDFNILTIRKIGNNYFFYLNKTFVFTCPFLAFYGSKVGFSVAGKSTILIDYLRVSKIFKL